MKFSVYSIWGDPVFYAFAAAFAFSMFFLVFSIRKYLEVKNRSGLEESEDDGEEARLDESYAEAGSASPPSVELAYSEADGRQADTVGPGGPDLRPESASGGDGQVPSKAEEFVKGLYQNLASLDGRMKGIEASFSRFNVNRDFTVTFLEDMISEFDALDKEKIKARIEYLLSDLKK